MVAAPRGRDRVRPVQPRKRTGLAVFDLNDPPSDPPAGCHDPAGWIWAYGLYRRHEPGSHGCCQRCCDQPSPCDGRRMAQRALLDAYQPLPRAEPLPGIARIVATGTCRWCRRPVRRHSRYGWFHISEGFLLCQIPGEHGLPMCTAEPDEQSAVVAEDGAGGQLAAGGAA